MALVDHHCEHRAVLLGFNRIEVRLLQLVLVSPYVVELSCEKKVVKKLDVSQIDIIEPFDCVIDEQAKVIFIADVVLQCLILVVLKWVEVGRHYLVLDVVSIQRFKRDVSRKAILFICLTVSRHVCSCIK